MNDGLEIEERSHAPAEGHLSVTDKLSRGESALLLGAFLALAASMASFTTL